jgi:hypothetical protein
MMIASKLADAAMNTSEQGAPAGISEGPSGGQGPAPHGPVPQCFSTAYVAGTRRYDSAPPPPPLSPRTREGEWTTAADSLERGAWST